jgi:hypothetical protein
MGLVVYLLVCIAIGVVITLIEVLDKYTEPEEDEHEA